MDTEPRYATDVLRWQAYRAALAAWADQMDRAPVEVPVPRSSPEGGSRRHVPR
jgi:hypothetical protein